MKTLTGAALVLALTACTQPPATITSDDFVGNWCNVDRWEADGFYDGRVLAIDALGRQTATHNTGGPFEEYYTWTVNDSGTGYLFYESTAGSNSFMEQFQEDTTRLACGHLPDAKMQLLNDSTLEVIELPNSCRGTTSTGRIPLTRLADSASCLARALDSR